MLEIDGINYQETIALCGHDGEELMFELLDVVPLRGDKYYVLMPCDDETQEPETVILKLERGDDGEETELCGLSSQTLLDEVYELFVSRMREDDDANE